MEECDVIRKPAHYTQGKIETWDFIIDKGLGFLEANVCKYIVRFRHKNGVQDLHKARAYLNKLIEVEEARAANP